MVGNETLHSRHLMVLYKASLMFLDIWYVYPNWTARNMRQHNSSSVKTRLFNCLDRDQLREHSADTTIKSQEPSGKRTSDYGVSTLDLLLELAARDKRQTSSSITSPSIPSRRVLFQDAAQRETVELLLHKHISSLSVQIYMKIEINTRPLAGGSFRGSCWLMEDLVERRKFW